MYNYVVPLATKIISLLILIQLIIISQQQEETTTNNNMTTLILNYDQRAKFSKNLAIFAINTYDKLSNKNVNQNIVFSPLSIQNCIAMVRIGAEGATAMELDRVLGSISDDRNDIAEAFSYVLKSYKDSNILKMANKIYVMTGHTIRNDFNEIVSKKFYSTAEEIDFSQNVEAANNINIWIESNTNNLIKNLISPNSISSDTRLVLLNAIYFKGEWKHKFERYNTIDDDFYLNEVDTVKVPMMKLKKHFKYADLPELDATILEMPYKNSDLSMLIILPNSRTGLKNLEEKLKDSSLENIINKMSEVNVIVRLPRFKAEFSIELNEALKELGITRMFTADAELGKMLESGESLKVSKVLHKAFIEVNEEGTEAAAATALRIMPVMGGFNKRIKFTANHPFLYMIVKTDDNYKLTIFLGTYKQ